MLAASQRLACVSGRGPVARQPAHAAAAAVGATRGLIARATGDRDSKSWSDIAAEAVGVVADVASKIKDSAAGALEALTKPDEQRRGGPLRRQADERQLPALGGGLLGGLVGGLVNQAVKGIASQLERSAAESQSVLEAARARIEASPSLRARLGRVRVGAPMSQAVSSSSINGRTSKTVTLLLPVADASGVPVAQAQVQQVDDGRQQSCRIAVRMREGDTLMLDDDERGSSGVGGSGEVVEAEFRDLK